MVTEVQGDNPENKLSYKQIVLRNKRMKEIKLEDVFEQVNSISSTKQEIRSLQNKYNLLITPALSDASLIPQIFEWYKETSPDAGLTDRDSKSLFMQCFVFVIALLYSPQSLAGGKLSLGLREKLSILLHYKSPTSISNVIPNLMFLYRSYQSYRDRVNSSFSTILSRLSSNNLL